MVPSLFVLALFLVPVFLPSAASADAVSDKRAEAQQIAAKLDELEQKQSMLDEKFNEATIGLAKANADVAAAQKRVDETNAQLDASAAQLRKFAVQAYMTGDDTQALDAILTSDASDDGRAATQKSSPTPMPSARYMRRAVRRTRSIPARRIARVTCARRMPSAHAISPSPAPIKRAAVSGITPSAREIAPRSP